MTETKPYGITTADEQYLRDSEIDEIVEYIATIDTIWNRLSNVRPHEWIDETLIGEINFNINNYARQKGWRVGARDMFGGYRPPRRARNVMTLLRQMAEESQRTK